ncbi:hypothetical protein [Rhizobium phage RHph_X2_30]|nr:hypothetical protein [Rhizobium phage RHph_X2_30]
MPENAAELAEALQHVRERGMYVSWLCQDSGDQWQCSLRRQYDLPFVQTKARTVNVRRGRGPTMAAALKAAMADDFLDILG